MKFTEGYWEKNERANASYAMPVSYTHLDVYKRQGKSHEESSRKCPYRSGSVS